MVVVVRSISCFVSFEILSQYFSTDMWCVCFCRSFHEAFCQPMLSMRHIPLITCPAALLRTTAGSIWEGIVKKQPVHPMRHLVCFVWVSHDFTMINDDDDVMINDVWFLNLNHLTWFMNDASTCNMHWPSVQSVIAELLVKCPPCVGRVGRLVRCLLAIAAVGRRPCKSEDEQVDIEKLAKHPLHASHVQRATQAEMYYIEHTAAYLILKIESVYLQ